MGIVNVAIAYIFIKDLTIPFKKTKAYKEGIIAVSYTHLRAHET